MAHPLSLAGSTGLAQRFGIAVELLEQKRNRPAADHPVVHLGVDGLERIVPVAVAISDEMRAGNEAFAHGRKQFFDMDGDAILMRRQLESVLAPPCDLLVEEA